MSLAPRLDLRQSQQLVMTPQLQQAIKLLQLNNIELEAHVLAEIEANPLIELEGGEATAPDEPAAATPSEPSETGTDELMARGEGMGDTPLDADYVGETFHHASDEPTTGPAGASAGSGTGEALGDIDSLGETALGLRDHLEAQACAQLTGTNLAVARYLIDQIDDAGYLRANLDEVASALGVTRARVEAILRMAQCFDPTGVGARTLAECLLLQAREAGVLDRRMRLLLKNLDVLARGDMGTLRRICGAGSEELAALIRTLRSFDPKPGMRFGGEPATPVAPDVLVRRSAAGWSIELNSATRREGTRQGVPERMHELGQLAVQGTRPARAHDRHGGDRDRAPAGKVLRARRAPHAPAQSAHDCHRCGHARIDDQPRHLEQISRMRARAVRAQILLRASLAGGGRDRRGCGFDHSR